MTTYTDAEVGAAFRVIASLFTGGAAAAPSAGTPKDTKGSATSASGGSAAQQEPSPSETPAGYSADELTTDYVTKRVMTLGAKKGKAAAKELLASFSNAAGEPCQRASEIDPDDFTKALDAIKEAEASG